MLITVFPHEDRALAHHLEVGPFSSNFIFSSVPGPLGWELQGSGRLVKNNIVYFTCVVFQIQDNGAYPLGIDDPPDAIDFYIVPFL